jgi:hypothetical protein
MERMLFTEQKLLSKQASKKEKFLQETALLNPENAEVIALIDTFKDIQNFVKDIEKEEKKGVTDENILFVAFLDKVAKPMFRRLGMANRRSDVVTELGYMIGETRTKFSLKDEDFNDGTKE